MRIIARRALREFVANLAGRKERPAVEAALARWWRETSKAQWSSMADVKGQDAAASIVSADRVVFNIKGNAYRLIVSVDFEVRSVWIKWIGSHQDYDKVDARTVDYER